MEMPQWENEALQTFVGMDMETERARKEAFLRDTLPRWCESVGHAQPGPTDSVRRLDR